MCLPLLLCLDVDFEQIFTIEIEILLCQIYYVFHASINFQVYDFDTCSVRLPFYHSRENVVFISCLKALYKKKFLWVKSNLLLSQDKAVQIYVYS